MSLTGERQEWAGQMLANNRCLITGNRWAPGVMGGQMLRASFKIDGRVVALCAGPAERWAFLMRECEPFAEEMDRKWKEATQ
jgi:hypothetical protein